MSKYGVPVISLRVVRDGTAGAEAIGAHCPAAVHAMLAGRYADLDRETTIVVHVNARVRVTAIEQVLIGGLAETHYQMREIFKGAILRNAAAIILAHNHPSGDPTPSPEDIAFTKRAVEAGELLDIEVLDHIVMSPDRFISMRERGLGGLN